MSNRWPNSEDTRRSKRNGGDNPNLDRLIVVGLTVALALFLASSLPPALVAPALAQLLFVGALGALFVAVLREDPLLTDEITAWDQAAILLALGLLSSMFADPAQISETIAAGREISGAV